MIQPPWGHTRSQVQNTWGHWPGVSCQHSHFQKVRGLSGEVIETSSAAVLPKNQLGSKMSAGQDLLWSRVRLLSTSTWTPMCAR